MGLALARTFAAITFGTAMLGTGILTAIPGTPLVFVYLGWMSTARMGGPAAEKLGERACVSPTYFATH